MVFVKIAGAGILFLGAVITFLFPFILDYQPKPLAHGGLLVGFVLMAVGAFMLFAG